MARRKGPRPNERGESQTLPRGVGGNEEGVLTSPILVIGLGNPLRGDDGVGVIVVRGLAAHALSPDVEVVDGGTRGLGIVNLLEGRQRVILVDAADMGRTPGEFLRITLEGAQLLGDEAHLSVHEGGVRDALLLAQALEMLPEEVVIFGVQPANLEWDSTLSPEVEAALPSLIAALLAEVAVSNQQTSRDQQPIGGR